MRPVNDLASCRSAIEWGWAILAGHLFELRGYRRKEGARLPFNPGQWLTLGELKRAVGMGAQVLLFHRYRDDDAEGYWFAVEPNCVIASFPKDRVDNQDVVNVRCVDPYGPLQLVPWEFFCKERQTLVPPDQGPSDVVGAEPVLTLEEAKKRLKELFAEFPVPSFLSGADGGDESRVLAHELAVHMLAAFEIFQRGEDLPDGFFGKLNALKDGADEIEVGGGGLGHGAEAASEAAEGQDGKEAA